jgi:hypothetical protein
MLFGLKGVDKASEPRDCVAQWFSEMAVRGDGVFIVRPAGQRQLIKASLTSRADIVSSVSAAIA